jgi:hypothetical protein
MTTGLRLQPARVIVDPNSVVPGEPTLTAARLADADRLPLVGEIVVASQPDTDGSDFAGTAEVVDVDTDYGLIMLRVDWSSFRDVPAPSSSLAGAVARLTTYAWRSLRPAESNRTTGRIVRSGTLRVGSS